MFANHNRYFLSYFWIIIFSTNNKLEKHFSEHFMTIIITTNYQRCTQTDPWSDKANKSIDQTVNMSNWNRKLMGEVSVLSITSPGRAGSRSNGSGEVIPQGQTNSCAVVIREILQNIAWLLHSFIEECYHWFTTIHVGYYKLQCFRTCLHAQQYSVHNPML